MSALSCDGGDIFVGIEGCFCVSSLVRRGEIWRDGMYLLVSMRVFEDETSASVERERTLGE